MNTRIGSPWRTLIVGPRLPSLLDRGGRGALAAADDDRRAPPLTRRARAAEDRQQDRRAEAREEMAVDLTADAGLAGEIGRRRCERDRNAVGPHEAGPHEIGAALPRLGRAPYIRRSGATSAG